MNETIHEKVSVICSYNNENGTVIPRRIYWRKRNYVITQLTYHHKIKQGRTLLHIFHVTDGTMDFSLNLDTDNLHWTLEEICDGTPS